VEQRARSDIDHAPARGQRWSDADEDLRQWVNSVVACLESAADVTGVYLHGSLATGSFYRPKSDVDLLVIVERPLADERRRSLAVDLLDRHDRRPIIGGLELSVLLDDAVDPFSAPVACELHFSEMWADAVRAGEAGPRGTDPDLAAHCTMARSRGVALTGPPPSEIFGRVPPAAYRDAVLDDARWITSGGIVESPFYGVLNLCRCLQVVVDDPGLPPSKDEGARWAMASLLAEHRPIIDMALECYRSRATVSVEERRLHGHRWDQQPLLDFAAYAREVLPIHHDR
jgi:predicted nucleotidyltransferase